MKPAVTGRGCVVSSLSISSVSTHVLHIHTWILLSAHFGIQDQRIIVSPCKVCVRACTALCTLRTCLLAACVCICACMPCDVGRGRQSDTWQERKQVPETPEPQCVCAHVCRWAAMLRVSFSLQHLSQGVDGCSCYSFQLQPDHWPHPVKLLYRISSLEICLQCLLPLILTLCFAVVWCIIYPNLLVFKNDFVSDLHLKELGETLTPSVSISNFPSGDQYRTILS